MFCIAGAEKAQLQNCVSALHRSNSITSTRGRMHIYDGIRLLYWWNSEMVQFLQLDRRVIKWNCTRQQMERHVIGHFGARVSGNFVELDTCVWNSVGTDTCRFDVLKANTWPRNSVQVGTSNFLKSFSLGLVRYNGSKPSGYCSWFKTGKEHKYFKNLQSDSKLSRTEEKPRKVQKM